MSERGGIISGYLLKVVLGFALMGGLVYEAGAVVFSKIQADSIALECADKASEEFSRSGSTAKATDAAHAVAERRGGELVTVEVFSEESRITATVRVRAKTYVIQRIGPLREHAVATTSHSSRIV